MHSTVYMSEISRLSGAADRSDFMQILERCISVLEMQQERGAILGGRVTGGLVEIIDYDSIVIISDLHGDSKTLFRILDDVNYVTFLANPRNKMIFLGDYVDRGSDSIGVLYAICYLKQLYSDSVILMRGNHEATAEFPFSPHDLPGEIEVRFGVDVKAVYHRVLSCFELLTLVTVVQGGLLLVHGGLPTDSMENWKQSISSPEKTQIRTSLIQEILWNDPRCLGPGIEWEPSHRGIGRHFGRLVTQRWLQSTGANIAVRGHEPCAGYDIHHNGKIMTLFSSIEAYPRFGAAYLIIGKAELDSSHDAKDLIRFLRFVKRV